MSIVGTILNHFQRKLSFDTHVPGNQLALNCYSRKVLGTSELLNIPKHYDVFFI
jgi:hypothetical protein